jgi:predicted deacylase
MKNFATHTTLLSALAALALLLPIGALLADEPVDAADEVLPAITDAQEAAEAAARPGTGPAAETGPAGTAIPAEHPVPADTDTPESQRIPVERTTEALAPTAPEAAAESSLPADEPVEVERPAKVQPPVVGDVEAHGSDASGIAIDLLDDPAPGEMLGTTTGSPIEEAPAPPLADAVRVADETTSRTLTLLNSDVLPGTYQRLSWSATEMFEDLPVSTPVLVVNGRGPGPTLCVTAAVHGDELNGIEMVRRVMHDLDPKTLSGAVIGVPIVNLQGFRRGSRYLPDRRDLNRYFPGNPRGSAAARIAHSFFTQVIEHCDALVDLHTGSFDRANLPQLRADLRNPDVVTLTHGFGATVILHSEPAEGTLRHAATIAGIPTVTLEAGGPSQLELKEVMHGVKGVETLLNTLGMVDKVRFWGEQQPVYYRSSWVRANRGGILLADVSLGSTVRRGDLLGTITDPMNNASTNLYSP